MDRKLCKLTTVKISVFYLDRKMVYFKFILDVAIYHPLLYALPNHLLSKKNQFILFSKLKRTSFETSFQKNVYKEI